MGILGPLLALLAALTLTGTTVWLGVRRKEKQRADARRQAQPTPWPPRDIEPALAYRLLNHDAVSVLPTMLDAAVSGAVRFHLGSSRDRERLSAVLVEPQRLITPGARVWAGELFDELVPGRRLSTTDGRPYQRSAWALKQQVNKELRRRGLAGLRFHPGKFGLALVSLAAYAGADYLAGFEGLPVPVWLQGVTTLMGLAFSVVCLVQLFGAEKLSDAGCRVASDVYGLGLEMDRLLQGSCDPITAHRLLPWAAVLGREDEWFDLLRKLEREGARTPWLTGTPDPSQGEDRLAAFKKVALELADDD